MNIPPEELYIVFAGSTGDSWDIRLTEALLPLSSRFRVAESPEEAMQICRSHLPDMVVVRHGGNMDGFALTAGLRALPKPPHVILVAEMDDLPAWRGAIESGEIGRASCRERG